MRNIFIGTVKSSYIALETLLLNGMKIEAVFTIVGNSYNSDYIDLRPLCSQYKIPCYSIKNINDKVNINIIRGINPDYIFVIGLSQIIKQEILEIPKWGCIGFHPTLLPKNRGRAVIPWTIINEEKETGITIFKIDEGMDSGDIIIQEKILLDERETANSLYDKVLISLKSGMKKLSLMLKNDEIVLRKQDEKKATYCAIRTIEDGYIDWNNSSKKIDKLIRAAANPYPGAYTFHKGEKLIILEASLLELDNWSGTPGQRVEIVKGQGVKVKTGNGLILIKKIIYQNKNYQADKFFKIPGKKFGEKVDR